MTQIRTIQTEGFTMDCCRFGSGERALAILPGLSVPRVLGAAAAIEAAYAPLAEDFTLYVLERRNELPPVYPVGDMARDTAAALRALGLERVSLFGASQGGMIAMEIALRDPSLVDRMILGSTSAHVTAEQFRLFQGWICLAKAGDAQALNLAFGEAVYPRAVFEQFRDYFSAAARDVTAEDLARFVTLAEGLRGFDIRERLGEIRCPTLVLGSRDDRVLGGAASEQLAAGIWGAELFLYEDQGHAAYDTAPDYRERMLRFLTSDRTN